MWGELTTKMQMMMARLKAGQSAFRDCYGQGLAIAGVLNTLRALQRKGLVLNLGGGVYALTPTGLQALAAGHYTTLRKECNS